MEEGKDDNITVGIVMSHKCYFDGFLWKTCTRANRCNWRSPRLCNQHGHKRRQTYFHVVEYKRRFPMKIKKKGGGGGKKEKKEILKGFVCSDTRTWRTRSPPVIEWLQQLSRLRCLNLRNRMGHSADSFYSWQVSSEHGESEHFWPTCDHLGLICSEEQETPCSWPDRNSCCFLCIPSPRGCEVDCTSVCIQCLLKNIREMARGWINLPEEACD